MNIRDYRLAKNMTQQQLADAIGVKVSTISRYETGIHSPSIRHMKKLCEVLGVPKETLMIDNRMFTNMDYDHVVNELYDSNPKTYATILNQYFRSAIIQGARCRCELCGCEAPFNDLQDRPYLDIYIIDKGKTKEITYKNVVALCPTCFRKMGIRKETNDVDLLKKKAAKHNY